MKRCSSCGWWLRSFDTASNTYRNLNKCSGRKRMNAPFGMMQCDGDYSCEQWVEDERDYTVPEKPPEPPSLQELNRLARQ